MFLLTLAVQRMSYGLFGFLSPTTNSKQTSMAHSPWCLKVSLVLSGVIACLVTCSLSYQLLKYLTGYQIYHLRAIPSQTAQASYVVNHPIPNPPIAASFMPSETQYSDDNSFLIVRRNRLKISTLYVRWNLSVIDSKSEHLHFFLAQPKPQEEAGSWC